MSDYTMLARAIRKARTKLPKCDKPMRRAVPPPIPDDRRITEADFEAIKAAQERNRSEA